MQINFYSNKEGIIDLFNWIKSKFPNLVFYSQHGKGRFNEQTLYINDVGYSDTLVITLDNSLLAAEMNSSEACVLDLECTFLWKNSIEFSFGYSGNKIFNYDFSHCNIYKKEFKKEFNEPFIWCRFYLDSYYLGDNKMYKSIYQKICGKIRRNSSRIEGDYISAYLYNSKES